MNGEGELIDLGVEYEVVQKSGTWLSYGDERIGQGRENAKRFLREYPEVADNIDTMIREKLGLLSKTEEKDEKKEPPVE